jgi:hypothetical protein
MRLEEVRNFSFFLPPKSREDLFIVRYAECSPLFEVTSEVRKAKLLETSNMDIGEFENSIIRIN